MTETKHAAAYIIAEAGINHGGDLAIAAEMIKVAAGAGVDAVKFQSFSAAGLTHAVLAADQHEFFARFELSRDEHRHLAALCAGHGVDFLSTPFDPALATMLADLGVPAFKIASCDLTNIPLIEHCAGFGKPLYVSTGMGNLAEARQAYEAARRAGSPRVVLLQCTTNYPTALADVNLRAMVTMGEELGCAVGYSDHSVGNWACYGAAALGAAVIEKHFCLDKDATGPDIPGSCSPHELGELVAGIRAIEACRGSGAKAMGAGERDIAVIARRSIYYAADLPAGHVLAADDFVCLRPAGGLSPARLGELTGRALGRAVRAGDTAALEDVAGNGPI